MPVHGTTRIPCLCSNLAETVYKMIGFTVVRGNDQGIPARVSAMTIEYGPPLIARRGERFFAPTHDRGAVLESMKNQQEGLHVR